MPLTISHLIDITEKKNIKRNDPCYCGSGKKYKKCHLAQDEGYTSHRRGGYISRVIEWVMRYAWFKDALAEKLHKVYGTHPRIEENQMAVVVEALVYEWKYEGKTPLQQFVEKANLNSSDRTYYQSWIDKTVFSLFIVEEVNLGTSILLREIIHEKRYLVFEKTGSYSLQSSMMIMSRLVPLDEGWMMTGADISVLPKEMMCVFEREKKHGRFKQISELEWIDAYYIPPRSGDIKIQI